MKDLKIKEINVCALHEAGHFLAFLILSYKITKTKKEFLNIVDCCKMVSILEQKDVKGCVLISESAFMDRNELKYYTYIYGCTSVYDYFVGKRLPYYKFEDFILNTGGKEDWDELRKRLTIQRIYRYYIKTRRWLKNKEIKAFYVEIARKVKRKVSLYDRDILSLATKGYEILKKRRKEI